MQGVNSSIEQIWREEVLYLHSLWHHGPPRNPNSIPTSTSIPISNPNLNPNPNSNPNPNPNRIPILHNLAPTNCTSFQNLPRNPNSTPSLIPISNPNTNLIPISHNLAPTNSTSFKKENNKKKRKNTRSNKKNKIKQQSTINSNDPQSSNIEWPVEPVPKPQKEIGWPDKNVQSVPATRPATAEEQEKLAALQLQQKGIKASQDFFSSKVSSDNEGEHEEEEDLMEEDFDESEEFKFFLSIFTEDSELRSYYEKHCDSGNFCCLACWAAGKKVGKTYKNCVAVVQHSNAISKTKLKNAHRAYSRAICKVLGWDVNRLPTIVLSLGDPLGRSLANMDSQASTKENDNGDQKEKKENDNGDQKGDKQNDNGYQEEDSHGNAVELVNHDESEPGNMDNSNVDQNDIVDASVNADKIEPLELQVSSMKDDAGNQAVGRSS